MLLSDGIMSQRWHLTHTMGHSCDGRCVNLLQGWNCIDYTNCSLHCELKGYYSLSLMHHLQHLVDALIQSKHTAMLYGLLRKHTLKLIYRVQSLRIFLSLDTAKNSTQIIQRLYTHYTEVFITHCSQFTLFNVYLKSTVVQFCMKNTNTIF